MFYAFRPADQDAEHKPLAVFFNGGPGFPTSFGLLAFGTGPMTLDAATMSATPVPNAASWSRFANLLYLDERMAGFSYGLGATMLPTCVMSEQEDAGDFVRSLLAFLDGHQAIRANPVVVVGESYGGIRATRMLDILLRYSTEAPPAGTDLQTLIQAHYDAVFPSMAGLTIPEATAATQFGAQVLIEPVVLGDVQMMEQTNIISMDPYVGNVPASQDPYDVRQPMSYEDAIDSLVLGAMSTASSAASLIGVPLASIPRLGPSARQGAFHPNLDPVNGVAQANVALTALLGALGGQDEYVALFGRQCPTPTDWMDPAVANLFAKNLLSVRTFITHARYDQVVYTPAIPAAFQNAGWTVAIDSAPRAGVVNPGWFTVTSMGQSTEIRWPPYDSSGHMVAMTEGAELATDVQGWLAGH
jgi:pimeloyl-ACP methyl ester carboxylesterase